jgi:hypothetical protein
MLTDTASKVFRLTTFWLVRSKQSRRIDTGIERRQQCKQYQWGGERHCSLRKLPQHFLIPIAHHRNP